MSEAVQTTPPSTSGTTPAANSEFRRCRNPIRFVTAASLFDGHDASINMIRRLLQEAGAEVVHLGHNRSVDEIVTAALQEDAQGIAISSYQGGHMEFLRYMRELLDERGGQAIRLFAGGGGTIVPREIEALHAAGIDRVFSPADGRKLGLHGMINLMLEKADFDPLEAGWPAPEDLNSDDVARRNRAVARAITLVEGREGLAESEWSRFWTPVSDAAQKSLAPVVGITGPGGAGKSSFVDELVLRFLQDHTALRIAVISVDPSKRRTGGALLGDRIRMNTAHHPRVYMRSIATRGTGLELSSNIEEVLSVVKAAAFDLVILESSGIGQAGAAIAGYSDVSLYAMTPEYGAASQLEKIEMLDVADLVILNKFDRRGAEDALRDVRKQYRRTRPALHDAEDAELPVFGTISASFNDEGLSSAFVRLQAELEKRQPGRWPETRKAGAPGSKVRSPLIPAHRQAYLSEVAECVRGYHRRVESEVEKVRLWEAIGRTLSRFEGADDADRKLAAAALNKERDAAWEEIDPEVRKLVQAWPELEVRYRADELGFEIRGKSFSEPLKRKSLSGLPIPRIALPTGQDLGSVVRFLLRENLAGSFPYTAGVFPLKRADEEPKRMFAGEGGPERTNRRFHYLCEHETAKRLSTAFDSVTLYGQDPEERPDIFGKVGESGVSICTLEDMRKLYAGFDLCDRNTSVSMTINGPAPIMLAFFLNTAIDQQVDRFVAEHDRIPNPQEHAEIEAQVLKVVRGTVQADILKEDQAQNTCIFSTGFALKLMGDIQEYFIEKEVRNYYSVSISGYHIAEAGANPVTQLAFTLANGFTYVEYYLARGMKIDDFAPNLSFFFSNGLDPEYTVLGRVARRIWSIALRDHYGAGDRSQKLKYHIQTSGRSLHAMEVDFNDIRTTLQALLALQDNCNSLHTNAYDEAVTTPTEESVRRAMAIQLIINREFGLAKNENPLQGSYVVEELTDLVEEAVLSEFDRISERGGVLGAMETQYQRGRIQEESLYYERLKHSGELPVIGVNCFLNPAEDDEEALDSLELTRSSEADKQARIAELRSYQGEHGKEAPEALERLSKVALEGGNVFAELMRTVRSASLGQITRTLFAAGGEYRRNL